MRLRQCVVCRKTIDLDRVEMRGAYRGFWTLFGCAIHSDDEWKQATNLEVERLMAVDEARRLARGRVEDDLGDPYE